MTELITAPRIAEFPVTSSSGVGVIAAGRWWASLSVVHEWLVHEFGEGELAKVEGLPLTTIVSMYPEGKDVAFFSLVRGTTMLGELQALFDAVARSVASEDSDFLYELNKVVRVHAPEHLVSTLEARNLHENIVWVAHEVLSTGYMDLYKLAAFVCAPLLVKPEFRERYLSSEPDWKPVLLALGLKDLWATVSRRIYVWREGDDDD